MNFLYTLLYIILFIFCLSVLVVVHELGHFAAAKFFKVYCQEFSIGFGPALIKKKRKNGETYFSFRAFPFGGYVSMYGEGVELPEGVDVDPSRSFTALKKWKRIIILFAGVFNNAILALILFMVSESCFVQKAMYLNYLGVKENSIAYNAGIKNEDYISLRQYTYTDSETKKEVNTTYYVVDREAIATYTDDTTKTVIGLLDINSATYSNRDYDAILKFYLVDDKGNALLGQPEVTVNDDKVKSLSYNVVTAKGAYKQYIDSSWVLVPESPSASPKVGEVYINKEIKSLMKWNGSEWKKTNYDTASYKEPEKKDNFYVWYDLENEKFNHVLLLNKEEKNSGLSFFYEEYWNNAGQVASKTFEDFGTSSTAIVRGLASLFTSTESWKDVGGVVAIGVQTTNILQNFGLGKFIYIWGLISVNLAIVNLLPFPGLDGWQIVVLVVEGVFHKDIPDRVKNIVSLIGLAILFSFMILILIKDVIGLF